MHSHIDYTDYLYKCITLIEAIHFLISMGAYTASDNILHGRGSGHTSCSLQVLPYLEILALEKADS